MNASPAPPCFELRNVRFAYEGALDVVRDLGFSIAPGEFVGLIGPNGAGKSTLLNLMNGLLKPTSGRVLLEGEDAAALEPLRRARRLGYVPQSASVMFPYTVAEIVAMGRHPHQHWLGGETAEDRRLIHEALEVTGTTPFARRRFSRLSGGEAQRVVIARALAQAAPILLLDEPTSSLDLYYQTVLYGLLEQLNRERALTVVVVTHDVNLAAEYCKRLIGIREGRVLVDGSPREIVTPATIRDLYGVQAEILQSGDNRLVRVRHFEGGLAP
jgi:iron complex transport system ATP-binding protein